MAKRKGRELGVAESEVSTHTVNTSDADHTLLRNEAAAPGTYQESNLPSSLLSA